MINNEHLVYQFQYTSWPDHGVPAHPLSVLSFIRHSSTCNSQTGGPVVVHCSAGIGRTGTYIVIDTMLKTLNNSQVIDIPLFLKHIRQQRSNLVQTEEQFIFIYDVLLQVMISESVEKQFQLIVGQRNEIKQMEKSYLHVCLCILRDFDDVFFFCRVIIVLISLLLCHIQR